MHKRMAFLLTGLGILLTGCAAFGQDADSRGDAPAEKVEPVQDVSEKKSPGKEQPVIPYENQIDLILQQRKMWCFSLPENAPEEYFADESDYYYQVSDRDQNGRLEIISSVTTGNGSDFSNDYYEVSEDGKSLKKLSKETPDKGKVSEPDLWNFTGYSEGYYDGEADIYHYVEYDHTHLSGAETEDAREDLSLFHGIVSIVTLCDTKSADTAEQWEEASKKYYQGMTEFTVTFQWFRDINERKYYDKGKIKVISDEKLREKLLESWKSFGIHYMKEEAVQNVRNPYFPAESLKDTEIHFRWNMMTSGKAVMRFRMDERGKNGILYRVSCHNPKEISDMESCKNSVKDWLEEDCSFYLWVTEAKIYYIPQFFDEYSGDDEYAKMRLLFYNEMPEYAVMVCQEEEMADTLEDMAPGEHEWIEKHPGEIRCYRSYTSRGEGYDTADILQFVWKKDVGLLGMKCAAHPAGGFSTYLWRVDYLRVVEDVMFSVDAD